MHKKKIILRYEIPSNTSIKDAYRIAEEKFGECIGRDYGS